jgi:hypothetical protein
VLAGKGLKLLETIPVCNFPHRKQSVLFKRAVSESLTNFRICCFSSSFIASLGSAVASTPIDVIRVSSVLLPSSLR